MNLKLILVIGIVSAFIGCTPDDQLEPVPDNSSSPVAEKDHSGSTQGVETLAATTEEPQDRQEPPVSIEECASSQFFIQYYRKELVQASGEMSLVLDVPVDLHSADCGAPDCYGHSMTLTLKLRRVGKRCEIVSAEASAEPFSDCGSKWNWTVEPWINNFVVKDAPDLSDDHLTQIELRDFERNEALLLLPNGRYYFYENVDASSRLHPQLSVGDEEDCCYGYTSSAALRRRFSDSQE